MTRPLGLIMENTTYANASERALGPGERWQPAVGRVLYSAAWLEGGDDGRLAHEVTVLARRLGANETPKLVANRTMLARTHKEAVVLAAHELIALGCERARLGVLWSAP